jgi:tetratricopeptide (TPR) repeat protein
MQGDYDAARPLYERALAIREQVLGPNHPETALALNNLAGLLYRQEDLSTARSLLEQSLAILQRALGPQHPTARVVQDNVEVLSRETAEIRSSTEVRG